MKHIVFCFDGTWNKVTQGHPTNVSKIARSVLNQDGELRQITYYDEGVGTHELGEYVGKFVNWVSGALGFGLQQNIVEAYTFLVLNYEPGDRIFVFGFSRGAFTARSFVGLIRNVAIFPKRRLFDIREAVARYISRSEDEHPNSHQSCILRYKYCPHLLLPGDGAWREKMGTKYADPTTELTIAYLGVWDTVGALGIPNGLGISKAVNLKYQFHDTRLSGFVEAARHAVAADEKRQTFEPALWTNLDELNDPKSPKFFQRIFPGTHSAIGGGGPHRGLSDGPLEWVLNGARDAGLSVDTAPGSPIYTLRPDHRDPLFNEIGKTAWSRKDKVVGAGLAPRDFTQLSIDQIDATVSRRWHDPRMSETSDGEYRPESLKPWWDYIKRSPPTTDINLNEEIFDGIKLADRSLKTPARVEKYTVNAEDRWEDIAKKVYGDARYWKALFLYNFDQKRVYDKDQLYASMEIFIPIYTRDGAISPP